MKKKVIHTKKTNLHSFIFLLLMFQNLAKEEYLQKNTMHRETMFFGGGIGAFDHQDLHTMIF